MPIYNYECECGQKIERIMSEHATEICCPECGESAKQVIIASGHYCGNDDCGWVKKSAEVFEADDPDPVVRDFKKNPTKSKLKVAMARKNLRFKEDNERRPEPYRVPTKELVKRLIKRRRIEIASR